MSDPAASTDERIARLEAEVAMLRRVQASRDLMPEDPPAKWRQHPHLDLVASADFDLIIWGKRRFSFRGHAQRAIVRAIWRDSIGAGLGITNAEGAAAAGSESGDFRVIRCFASHRGGKLVNHPAWGTLIIAGGGRFFFKQNPKNTGVLPHCSTAPE